MSTKMQACRTFLAVKIAGPWRRRAKILGSEAGMSTVEYAVGTVAAAAFAAVLYAVVTGASVVSGLGALVQRALSARST